VSASFELKGMSILPVLMELTHLSGISQVLSSSVVTMVTMATTVGSSSSSPGEIGPLRKKAHFGALLRVSSRYVCGAAYPSHGFSSLHIHS
jgi:hypothetical protein